MADLSKMQVGTTVYNMKDVTARTELNKTNTRLDVITNLYTYIENTSYTSLIDGLKAMPGDVLYLAKDAYENKSVGLLYVQNVDGGYMAGVLVPEFTTTYPGSEEWELYQGTVYLAIPEGTVLGYQIRFTSDTSFTYRELKCNASDWI